MCAENGHGEEPQSGGAGGSGESGADEARGAGPETVRPHPARAAAPGMGDAAGLEKRRLRAWGPGGARDLAARGLDEPAARQIYSPQRVMPAPRRVLTGTVPEWWWSDRPRRALCEVLSYYRPRRLLSPEDPAGPSLLGPSSLRLWFMIIPGLPRRWSRG